MGGLFLFNGHSEFERMDPGAFTILEAAEPFAQPSGAGKDVDNTYAGLVVPTCCGQCLDSDYMVDVMSAERRSALMSRIQGKNTAPELLVRKYLWRAGLRYRLHERGLPGKPDLVLKRWGAAVFIHGCFWHRHEGCPLFRLPKTRADFWDKKLRNNQVRDLKAIDGLSKAGWRVCVVWECALRGAPQTTCQRVVDWIMSGNASAIMDGFQAGWSSAPPA